MPIIIIAIVVVLILILLTTTTWYFLDQAIFRKKKKFLVDNPDLNNASTPWVPDNAWLAAQPLEDVFIQSGDGLRLHGAYLKANSENKNVAILAHGYTSRGKNNGSMARLFYEVLGYNILLPDNRAHGESQGVYIGFGWPDRKDYLQWIDYVIAREGEDCQIVLHGLSMGGATVLMVSGEKLPGNVKAIISDCAYTSAYDVLSYRMKRIYKIPSFPFIQLASLGCKLAAGYSFSEASAVSQVKKATVPILFIHGEDDKFVPVAMVHQLYKACLSEKSLFVVPKAGHAESFYTDREGYIEQVSAFIQPHLVDVSRAAQR